MTAFSMEMCVNMVSKLRWLHMPSWNGTHLLYLEYHVLEFHVFPHLVLSEDLYVTSKTKAKPRTFISFISVSFGHFSSKWVIFDAAFLTSWFHFDVLKETLFPKQPAIFLMFCLCDEITLTPDFWFCHRLGLMLLPSQWLYF